MKNAALALVSLLVLASCAGQRATQPSVAELRKMPVKQASTFSADIAAALAEPVPQRIGPAPAIMLDYYRQADGIPSYASYSPSAAELALFAEYYADLPPRFKATMERKLLGIYFIENFAGGGMTDFAFGPGEGQDSLYLYLVLNPKVLSLGLSD